MAIPSIHLLEDAHGKMTLLGNVGEAWFVSQYKTANGICYDEESNDYESFDDAKNAYIKLLEYEK